MRSLRILILFPVIVLLFCAPANARVDSNSATPNRVSSRANYTPSAWLDVGRIKLFVNNHGTLDYPNGFAGGYWPRVEYADIIVFDVGPCLIGKVNSSPAMGYSVWGSSYSPGPVINGLAAKYAAPGDSMLYRVYRISHGDTRENNPDFDRWPVALGAPVDPAGHPCLYGNQTLWTLFNNLDSAALPLGWDFRPRFARLPVEIHQAVYAHGVPGRDTMNLLANVAFFEWTIINKGNVSIDSAYFSLWTDIDFNGAEDNMPGVDTVNQVGYCWQPYDTGYGGSYIGVPRAVGFVLLYGPTVDSPESMATFQGKRRENARNLSMSSFWGIIDDSVPDSSFIGPAYSVGTAWNIARGLDKYGNPIVDSVTHQVTKFPYSGDPLTGTGWLNSIYRGGGAGFNMFSGPFTMAPNDTQWVMMALVPVMHQDRVTCVYLLRQYASILRSMSYSALVDTSYVPPSPLPPPPYTNEPSPPALFQNYPNPFNAQTTISFAVPWAGAHVIDPNGNWAPNATSVRIVVFDAVGRQIIVLMNEEKTPGIYEVNFDGTGLASGTYFYRLETAGQTKVKKMVLLR